MTVDAFITMALSGPLSASSCSAPSPTTGRSGPWPSNTLNIVICAYCWYVIIAFTSFGTRDPYVYAMGGWVICFGSRSLARMLLLLHLPVDRQRLAHQLASRGSCPHFHPSGSRAVHARRARRVVRRERSSGSRERAGSSAKPKPMRPNSAAALAERRRHLQGVVFNAAKREASAQQTASEALKAAEARQCIRCNEECAAIREQLLQIDPSSISLASAPSSSPSATMPSPLASSASAALEPSPIHLPQLSMGEAGPIPCASNVGRMGEHFLLTSRRDGRAHPLRAGSHTEESGRMSCSSPPPPRTATSSASTASAACTRAGKSRYLNSYEC